MSFIVVGGRKINLNTCPDCKGSGHTEATAPVVEKHKKAPRHRTVSIGSGCLRCRGKGVTA